MASSRKEARDAEKRASLLKELDSILAESSQYEDSIGRMLSALDPDVSKLRDAINDFEDKLSLASQANAGSGGRRYSIPGLIQLRRLLDDDMPVFSKVDQQVMDNYRKSLLQHYHPDKATGDAVKFQQVKDAYATSNLELLALMYSYLEKSTLDIPDLHKYVGAAFRKLATMRTKNTYKICMLYMTNPDPAKANAELTALIARRATVIAATNLAIS